MEGYSHFTNISVKLEASESYDEEDYTASNTQRLEGLTDSVSLTLKQFYQNLGDLTNSNRYQPGYRRASRQAVLRRRKLRAEKQLKEGKALNDPALLDAGPGDPLSQALSPTFMTAHLSGTAFSFQRQPNLYPFLSTVKRFKSPLNRALNLGL